MSNQGPVLTKFEICQSAAGATGNGTAIPVSGWSAVSLQVTGTFVGTLTFEGSQDGSNYVSLQGFNVADGTVGTTVTAAGIYVIPLIGLVLFRARVSAWTSGAITATACAVTNAPGLTLADVDIAGAEVVSVSNLPAALAAGGGLKVEGVAGGVAQPVSIATAPALVAGTANIGKVDPNTATPTIYNVTCTNANAEYSQALPANCRYFEFQARTEAVLRFAFATGKVATPTEPYMTLKAGDYYCSPPLSQGASPSTLYVASPTAGTVLSMIAWV